MSGYDAAFFRYVNSGAMRSAERIVPRLATDIPVLSVLDVGCGQGAWLEVWRRSGAEVFGIDGAYIDRHALLIPQESFSPHDLSEPFNLERRYDLVQSLEVAEHLPESRSREFVTSLVRHSDLVLFSAAPKGQGGHGHINEQPYDYWRALFREHDYFALDCVRPHILHDRLIEPWYRYNMLLYASKPRLADLPTTLLQTRIPDSEPVADVSPAIYRMRKIVVAKLPVWAASAIAKVKERLVASLRARAPTPGSWH